MLFRSCRLTILDQGPLIEQYLLIRPTGLALQRFQLAAIAAGIQDLDEFFLPKSGSKDGNAGAAPMLYRLRLARTPAAQPGGRRHRDRDLLKPWLRIKDAAGIPHIGSTAPEIPYQWDEPGDA